MSTAKTNKVILQTAVSQLTISSDRAWQFSPLIHWSFVYAATTISCIKVPNLVWIYLYSILQSEASQKQWIMDNCCNRLIAAKGHFVALQKSDTIFKVTTPLFHKHWMFSLRRLSLQASLLHHRHVHRSSGCGSVKFTPTFPVCVCKVFTQLLQQMSCWSWWVTYGHIGHETSRVLSRLWGGRDTFLLDNNE